MGLSFHRSIKVGPFRLSASKSGINVSAGIKGFRVGAGPRGNYVSATALGVTVRESLAGRPHTATRHSSAQHAGGAADAVEQIATTEADRLRDSSSAELVARIQAARRTLRLCPLLLCGWAVALIACINLDYPVLIWVLVIAAAAWTSHLAYRRDALRCLVPIVFSLEEPYLSAFKRLDEGLAALRDVAALWHIDAQGRTSDPKYHAGAASLVRRHRVRAIAGQPPAIHANIGIPQLLLGSKRLAFLPDRMLVYEGSSVGAVSYVELKIALTPSRFIEEGFVPHDAKRVDTTWMYINKHGGPDRRFRSNRQLPVLLYEKIEIFGPSGFHEVLQASRLGVGRLLASALEQYRSIAAQPAPTLSTATVPPPRAAT